MHLHNVVGVHIPHPGQMNTNSLSTIMLHQSGWQLENLTMVSGREGGALSKIGKMRKKVAKVCFLIIQGCCEGEDKFNCHIYWHSHAKRHDDT